MISKQDVEHVARLARIALDEKELLRFQRELGAILDYVKELERVDVKKTEATSHITGAENVMREDVMHDGETRVATEKLVGSAPRTKDGFIKTKAIL